MKKFFALLFVCAGLTAMAVTPHVNTNVKMAQGKAQKSMVLKCNTLSSELSAPVMKVTDKTMTPQKLFAEKGVTPAQNRLMKKAPRRVGAEDVLANKLTFMLAYAYDESAGGTAIANDYLWGGWNADMEQVAEDQFNAYIYFTGIPFTINVNYDAVNEEGSAEMVMETLAGFHWADTTGTGNSMVINDTTEYIALWDEAYMLNDDPNAEPANLIGTLYEDGTIFFPDGWTLYDVAYVKKTTFRNGQEKVTYDTVAGLLCDFMHSTYLITANANHEFVAENTGATKNVDAYMFQYDDTTAIAWNIWGMGNRGIEFYIHEDGSMTFPSYQVVYTEDISSYAQQYTQYDWSIAYEFFNFGMSLDETGEATVEDSLSEDDVIGTCDANGVYWDASVIYDIIARNGSYYFGLGFYPYIHNKLTFNSHNDFFILYGQTETPTITAVENDDNVVVTANAATDEETTVLLYIYDPETEMATLVTNPYTVERTDVDQTIIFAARAQAYGKTVSEWAVEQIVIPAKVDDFLRGDVDADQTVGIADVTALIDYILTGVDTGLNLNAADCDLDEEVGIADVTSLIDFILTGNW
jgi:hypothetical protein